MAKKYSHEDHDIISETQFLFIIIKYIFLFPYSLAMFLAGKRSSKELFSLYYEFGHFFKDAKITYYLIIANIGIFIIEIFVLIPLGFMDYLITSPENLIQGNILSLVTAIFLHANMMHLFGNMLFLFVFGRVVEKHYGQTQMLIIYFGAGIISSFVSSYFFLSTGLGASGAISGLVAAAILIRPFYVSYIAIMPLPLFFLGFLQIFGDFIGFSNPDPTSNVGHIAHLSGYASVVITAFLLSKERKNEMKKGLMINFMLLGLFLILSYLF